MFKNLVALLAGAMLMMSTSAMALTYSPTISDLLSFELVDSTPVISAANLGDNGVGGVEFSTIFENNETLGAYAAFGMTFATPLDLTAYDTFELFISNDNENPWDFGLWVAEPIFVSPVVSIVNGASAVLSFDLTGLDAGVLASIDALGVYVTADLPIVDAEGRKDYTAEFGAAPVPEPGTLLLLGGGLVGLAYLRKRKKA